MSNAMSSPRLQQIAAQHAAAIHLYKTTGEIDSTSDLYLEVYEYFANEMDPKVRRSFARQFDYITEKIRSL